MPSESFFRKKIIFIISVGLKMVYGINHNLFKCKELKKINFFKILLSLHVVNVLLYPLTGQIHSDKTPRTLNEFAFY